MPRKTRMYLPGIPAHVVQRGHNRNACFFADDDYQFYLECLGQGLRRYGVQLHAHLADELESASAVDPLRGT